MNKWIATTLLLTPLMVNGAPLEFRAAGSLKAAMTELIGEYQKATPLEVEAQFAPSGLLRKRIEQGEHVDVYASANMKHPLALREAGRGGPVVMFARNKLCAIAQPEVAVDSETLLDRLLDPKVRVGTSTPKADPAGDYAWKLFDKADKLSPGATSLLQTKALQLTGGPDSAKAPKGRNPYGWVMENKRADIFLTYCTNAVLARKEVPGLQIISVPEALSVGANYGLMVLNKEMSEAPDLAMYILSEQGQQILASYGFDVPLQP
ncbi:molybdate ABC transporter substrate-binding protein [uncultured Shewanella sp.]|uniref:molybdate ABC transporter substrate-binding protein n=1 Tax=Shewanella atlantica TaxID=271099 RepID=UPI00261F9DDF|nr:molybdate ABC transporter substrate-binding protein [uncultured Shewanella sp.]